MCRLIGLGCLLLLLVPRAGTAQPLQEQETLIVGTKEAPPFAIKRSDGTWTGISIELWQRIADDLGVAYELREYDLQGLIEGVEAGSLDVAAAALTVTAEREEHLDFTHSFYASGLGIAVSEEQGGRWLAVVRGFLSPAFLQVVGVLVLLLLVIGFFVWLAERKENPEQFGGSPAQGIASGFWWSAVTMTTVGYGDKSPKTTAGRVLGLIWMFTAVIIISSFTAAIASSLTVSRFSTTVEEPGDLHGVRVGVILNTTSADYLSDQRIDGQPFDTPEEALEALQAGQVDAFVYDAPLLRYFVNRGYDESLEVLPITFRKQYYGLALPSGSPLLEPVNRSLLEQIGQPDWTDLLYQYLGS